MDDKRARKIQESFREILEGGSASGGSNTVSKAEMDKKRGIATALERKTSEFRSRYGEKWRDVMHATAMKLATKKERTMKEDKHTAGATRPERMVDKFTPSDKKFADAHGGIDGTDSGIDGAKAAQQTADAIRNSEPSPNHVNRPADNSTGDKSVINKASDITQRAGFKEAKTYEELMRVLSGK